MSPGEFVLIHDWVSFPRVSGDEPRPSFVRSLRKPFSPRERG